MLHDPVTNRVSYTKETTINIEHSLVSLSKWESKWKRPFLNQEIPVELFDDYIRCMTITQHVDETVYLGITQQIRDEVRKYMDDPMTAAVIHEDQTQTGQSHRFTTSDLIYYWMTELNIPFECQKWHLNRLLTLIRISNIEKKKQNPKKANKSEVARRHHAVNAARRAKKKPR